MSDALRLAGSFALSMIAVGILVPVVIRLAVRTHFLDRPAGYKGHTKATPYLGGVAIVGAVTITVLTFGVATSRFAPILIWGLVLFVVGTIDDKRNLSPLIRLVIEVGAGVALWNYGLGWAIFPGDAANIALTVLWVVGLVNAFNLMDNMDGAASSVAAISATGAAALAVIGGDIALAVIVLALAGACVGFLPFNLRRPSRIFLGDGGSMPLGFVVAAAVMATPGTANLGWSALLAVAPIVGLPILDTVLVVISRKRGGRAILSGGRDHLTHRLRSALGSAHLVALFLATAQAGLCLTAVLLSQTGAAWVIAMAGLYVVAAGAAVYALESRFAVSASADAYGVVPGPSRAAAATVVEDAA